MPLGLIDTGGRRTGIDRRDFSYTNYLPNRRVEEYRRNGLDRRTTFTRSLATWHFVSFMDVSILWSQDFWVGSKDRRFRSSPRTRFLNNDKRFYWRSLIRRNDQNDIISVVIVGSYPIGPKRTDSNNNLSVYLVIVIEKIVFPPRIPRHICQIRPVPAKIAPPFYRLN